MLEEDTLPLSESEQIGMIRDAARHLLQDQWPADKAVCLARDSQAVRTLWKVIAKQGWTALNADSLDMGLDAAITLMQELGRAACPLPLLDAVLANTVFVHAGEEAVHLLGELASGEAIVAWAFANEGQPDGFGVQVHDSVLSGRVAFVENMDVATHLLVVTGRAGEVAVVRRSSPDLEIIVTPGLSEPPLAEVHFDRAQACLLGGLQCLDRLSGLMRLLLAARAWGSARYGLEIASDYAKVRTQFGRRIGEYQAIQHKFANCLILLEVCRLALVRAGAANKTERAYCAALASALATQHLRNVVLELHHGFGGISFWNEHEMPRHFHRIHGDLTRLDALRAGRRAVAAHVAEHGVVPPFSYGRAADALREEARGWLAENWKGIYPPEARELPVNERKARPEFSRKLGEKGWLGMFWFESSGRPKRTALEHLALEEELAYSDAPTSWHTAAANMIGPALQRFGNDLHRRDLVPGIVAGDVSFALGYSEPDHGSDLAGIRTTATRTPDGGWRIRGQKIFTSAASWATHIWMAVRTDLSNQRHGGISVFVLPMNAPGISSQPMIGLSGHSASVVFFDDVEAPPDALVGEVNGGWRLIMQALGYERVSMGALGSRARGYFDKLVASVRASSPGGKPMISDPLVLDQLGMMAAEIEGARLLAVQTARMVQEGEAPLVQAAILKVYSSELMERLCEAAFDILGTGAALKDGPQSAVGDGTFEYGIRDALQYTIGGGTNEIQRSLIAHSGLGLPR